MAFKPFTTTRRGTVTYRCKHPLISVRTTSVINVFCNDGNVMYATDETTDVAWMPLCAVSDVVKFVEA
jgi:hypothetical protein